MISINKFNSPNFGKIIIKPEAESDYNNSAKDTIKNLSVKCYNVYYDKVSDVILGKDLRPEVKLKNGEATYKGYFRPSILSSDNILKVHTIVDRSNSSKPSIREEMVSVALANNDEMNKIYEDMTNAKASYMKAIIFADALEREGMLSPKSKKPIDLENKSINLDAFFNMSDEELKNLPNQIKEDYNKHHENISSLNDKDKVNALKEYANFYEESCDLLKCIDCTLNNEEISDEMFELPINMKAQYYTFIDKVSKSNADEKSKILKRNDNLKNVKFRLFALGIDSGKEMLDVLYNSDSEIPFICGNRWG